MDVSLAESRARGQRPRQRALGPLQTLFCPEQFRNLMKSLCPVIGYDCD